MVADRVGRHVHLQTVAVNQSWGIRRPHAQRTDGLRQHRTIREAGSEQQRAEQHYAEGNERSPAVRASRSGRRRRRSRRSGAAGRRPPHRCQTMIPSRWRFGAQMMGADETAR
eukprot:scaffold27797_cov28-Tisochrysis_lutea.AAC.3